MTLTRGMNRGLTSQYVHVPEHASHLQWRADGVSDLARAALSASENSRADNLPADQSNG